MVGVPLDDTRHPSPHLGVAFNLEDAEWGLANMAFVRVRGLEGAHSRSQGGTRRRPDVLDLQEGTCPSDTADCSSPRKGNTSTPPRTSASRREARTVPSVGSTAVPDGSRAGAGAKWGEKELVKSLNKVSKL